MQKITSYGIILATVAVLTSCQQAPDRHWIQTIPDNVPTVIVSPEGTSPSELLEREYIPMLDDITSSAIQLISQIDSYPTVRLELKALALYPGAAQLLQPLWVMEAPDFFIQNLQRTFYQDFTQNTYRFLEQEIHKLSVQNRMMYAVKLDELLLVSESSLAIEDAIRSYSGTVDPIDYSPAELQASTLILNTPSLDKWVDQLARVAYRPGITGAFSGTGPVTLNITRGQTEETGNNFRFAGDIPLTEEPKSELIAALSSENAPISLDRYISSDASSFALFRLAPRLAPPSSSPDTTRLDSLMMSDRLRYAGISRTLDPEFALVAFAESGFLSTGEHLYLRKLQDPGAFVQHLDELAGQGFLRTSGDLYHADSGVLAKLIGSELCGYTDFYIDVTGDVAVISRRNGLAATVESDRNRRRVMYYEDDFMDIRQHLPDQVSGLAFLNTDFDRFIQPFLRTENSVDALASNFDMMAISLELDSDNRNLVFNLNTYTREQNDSPYEEQWFFPTGGSELTGPPVLADIRGSSRDETIFATTSGSVYALATDGTIVMQTSTEGDIPVGSPVVYDWYGTNQNVILLAAGNKIYGWNEAGSLLPQFPFELDEPITSPLAISDLNRNGLPEAIVATADRQLHALDGRGNNISSWPLTTNAVINEKPTIDFFLGSLSVVAFSENTVHVWNTDGTPKAGFPTFINAPFAGSPLLYNGQVLGGAADGYLYSIGSNKIFSDSLNVYRNVSDSSAIEAVYISNSALVGTPSFHNLTLQTEEQQYSEEMLLTMASNGSVFLVNREGELRFTQSMGQPASGSFSPTVLDINGDGIREIIALAESGRLYAWQVIDGTRIYSLPTSGMRHPIVSDLDGDGNNELIAQTRDGVRAWTIYPVSDL